MIVTNNDQTELIVSGGTSVLEIEVGNTTLIVQASEGSSIEVFDSSDDYVEVVSKEVVGIMEDTIVYAKRVDFIDEATVYKGEAAVGSVEGAPAWRIRKIIIAQDGDVSETWASGEATFNKIWADRVTYAYI